MGGQDFLVARVCYKWKRCPVAYIDLVMSLVGPSFKCLKNLRPTLVPRWSSPVLNTLWTQFCCTKYTFRVSNSPHRGQFYNPHNPHLKWHQVGLLVNS